MSAILNIGRPSDVNLILDAADEVGLSVLGIEATAECFIVKVEGNPIDDYPDDTLERVFDLCVALERECIAAYQNGAGHLIGPYTDDYAPFDYFKFKDFS